MAEPNQFDADQMAQIRQQAWQMFEGQLFNWFDQLRVQIQTRQSSQWRPADAAIQDASQIEANENIDQALRQAMRSVQAQLMRVVIRYIQQHQNPHIDTQPLKDELQEFLAELHNPETREVLLLAVKPEYRDHVRDRLGEFGSIFWGLIDLAMGNETPDLWFLLDTLSALEDTPLEALVAQLDSVSMEDVPQEVLE